MIDLASALWNQRHAISESKDRLAALRKTVNWPGDLVFATWIQLYAFCLEFRPDLIVEIGRGYGNSTCVFTEAANQLENTQVVSIGYDSETAWKTRTVPGLRKFVGTEWFKPLQILEQDALKTDFSTIFSLGTTVLFFWDAHGFRLANYILANVMPHLKNKRNVTLVHDISDARYDNLAPTYLRADGLPQFWLGDLVGSFEELIPLYDFLSRNRIIYDTPRRSFSQEFDRNIAKRDELEQCCGTDFPDRTPLDVGGLVYFDLSNRRKEGQAHEIVFPEFTQTYRESQQPTSTEAENKDAPVTIRKIAKFLCGKGYQRWVNFSRSRNQ